jgi:hypothetical protein
MFANPTSETLFGGRIGKFPPLANSVVRRDSLPLVELPLPPTVAG